ncbi:MAG: ATP-binding protein [Pseudooceanicola sp.]
MAASRHWTGWHARPLRLILVGTIAAFCAIVNAYLATEVRGKLSELASSPADNMNWTLSQLEVEFLEFALALQRALAVPDQTDETAVSDALSDLRLRYDILYSRVDTLSASPLYADALTSRPVAETFSATVTAIKGLAPTIDSGDAALMRALPAMARDVAALRPAIRDILTSGNQSLVGRSDRARTDMADVLFRLAVVVLILLVALGLLVLMFRHLAIQNERRTRAVMATSARLAAIVSTSRDAILVLDRSGRVDTANSAAAAMFGIGAEALQHRPIGDLVADGSADNARPLSAEDLLALAGAETRAGHRMTGRTASGGRFPVELSVGMTERSRAWICVCILRDVTHQVATEAELKDSRDQALAGERAKARFLGVVSHEMRTPLNGIIGTVDLMADAPTALIRQSYLPVLRNSSAILLDLVNDVLDITQIESRRPQAASDFDLDAMIASILEAETPRARDNGNRLARREEGLVGTVSGDVVRLRQVVMNLLSNAVKFTRDGTVTVSARRTKDGRIAIEVRDTGIGIDPADHEAIFEDFVRTDAATRAQVQGTGLGLGIARQLARSMGGDITLESAPGLGSTFRLTLPLPPARAEPAPPRIAPAELPVAETRPLDILLVEDNATNRFVARSMLLRAGHRVTEAHDGAAALNMAQMRAHDLILMDVSMPVMDGIEATRAIRAGRGPNRTTPIIALTAHTGAEIATALREAGMTALLAKPLTSADLNRAIAEIFRVPDDIPGGSPSAILPPQEETRSEGPRQSTG